MHRAEPATTPVGAGKDILDNGAHNFDLIVVLVLDP
jgi:hypothetical protein